MAVNNKLYLNFFTGIIDFIDMSNDGKIVYFLFSIKSTKKHLSLNDIILGFGT